MRIFIVGAIGVLNGIALSMAGINLSNPLWWVVAVMVSVIATAAVNK